MSFAHRLDTAIRAVAPIHGVSVGRREDKSTWRIDFKDEATEAQRDAALAVIAGFDVAACEAQAAKDAANALLDAELAANDLKAVRALLDGDQVRIAEWRDKQAALRTKRLK